MTTDSEDAWQCLWPDSFSYTNIYFKLFRKPVMSPETIAYYRAEKQICDLTNTTTTLLVCTSTQVHWGYNWKCLV